MMSSIHSRSVQPPENSIWTVPVLLEGLVYNTVGEWLVSLPYRGRENQSFVGHCLWPCDDHRTVQGVHHTTTDGG